MIECDYNYQVNMIRLNLGIEVSVARHLPRPVSGRGVAPPRGREQEVCLTPRTRMISRSSDGRLILQRPSLTVTILIIECPVDGRTYELKNKIKTHKIKMNRFRVRSKNLFLTYPKCKLDKETMVDAFDHCAQYLGSEIVYVICAQEVHNDGHLHIHAVLCFKDIVKPTETTFDVYGYHPHIEACKSLKKSIEYCKKEDKNPYIEGKCPIKEVMSVKERNKLLLDKPLHALVLDGDISMFSVKTIFNAKMLLSKPQGMERRVIWIWGDSGIGKSRTAEEWLPLADHINYKKGFWNGYFGGTDVIINDLRNEDGVFTDLLAMFDRYKYVINVKGNYLPWVASRIIVTSIKDPATFLDHWFGNQEEPIRQLLRRIEVIHMEGYYPGLQNPFDVTEELDN